MKINEQIKKWLNERLKTELKQTRHLIELSALFILFAILEHYSILSPSLTIFILSSALFIWSARYGLVSFLLSLSLFELILILYISKKLELVRVVSISTEIVSLYTITIGLFLGIIGELLNKKIYTLENEQKKLELQREELLNDIEKLNSIISQLQMRVYFEGEGLIVLLERLKELEILDLDEMLTRAVEVIANFFELDNLNFYRADKNFLRFVAGTGKRKLPNSFEISKSKVISKAVEKGYATFPEIIFESEVNSFEPWFAICVGRGEDLSGIFVVEEIDVDTISETLVQYLNAVVSWLHSSIKIIQEQQELFVQRYKEPDGTWKEEYYESRKSILEKRKELFGIPYEEICLIYKKELHKTVLSEFRTSDIASSKIFNGDYMITKVLLPVCDPEGKKRILMRIKEKLDVSECQNYN
ncbi:MAG: hypothetical protein ACK4MM_01450 [Fervidobacterium sp.]